ncbi:MAG: aminotransferase [Dethiosulfovibrio peptidovorans]|nr:MAG: aminotransferase [Dethiosulfovibrio peptidovorans]
MIDIKEHPMGKFFENPLQEKIEEKFLFLRKHPLNGKKRLFFDNAGGALRLKESNDVFSSMNAIPDCPERDYDVAEYMSQISKKCKKDIETMLNVENGFLLTDLTASQINFKMIRTVIENVPGDNIVTTILEHPSSFDVCEICAEKVGKELRIARSNPVSGNIDVDNVIKLVDKNTCLLNIIYASNISGAVLDIKSIINQAKLIKPDLYITIDAVQHIQHGSVDLKNLNIDGISLAPYKFFSCRGIGFGYISERLALLPHDKLKAKNKTVWALGSPATAHFAAFSEVINYVKWIGAQYVKKDSSRDLFTEGMNRITLQERALMNALINGTDKAEGLSKIKKIQVHFQTGDYDNKDLLVAISIIGKDITPFIKALREKGILICERTAKSLYSKRMLDSLGIDSIARITPLHCNSEEDITDFLKITKKIVENM